MATGIADGSFEGKVALVTGGTSGIGRAAALLYARKGAKVVVAGRRASEGDNTVGQIQAAGGEGIFVATDVSKAADVQTLLDRTLSAYGRLDAVFNNAGVEGKFGPLTEADEEVWDQTIDINLKGAWLSLKYQIPALLQSGGGAIVFNSSVVAEIGLPSASIYSASKGGVVSLARTAAIEYAAQNIRINVVNPGAVWTDMANRGFGDKLAFEGFMVPKHPIGRVGTPEEIAEAAVWLTSDAASFITGQVLNVDGGLTAQ